MRWTDVGDPSLDTIDFFIGEASWGSRGQYVGSAARNSLYARLIVPDDMRECVSYLSYSYGASTDREYVKRNIKGRVGTLPTPENVYIQIPERSSEGWLHWNRLSDSSVLGYRVYVSTEGDRSGDSLHAIVSADVHMLFLGGVIPTNGYFVQAFGANELQSCKARCSIVVSTNDDQHEDVKPVSGINVLPHPVQQTSIVRVANARTVGSDIIIRDLRGEIVTTLPLHQVAPMVYEAPWSCRDLVNGVYFIQVHTHNGVVTYKASVTK